jgi:hypothetical protein
MKSKIMLGLLASALIFTNCSKEEERSKVISQNSNVIGFDISTGKTRASIADINTLQSDANGFGVYATKGATLTPFITNQGYAYAGGAWQWVGTPAMWPTNVADYPVNFYAYHPKDVTSLDASLGYNYTIAATPDLQKDLLASNRTNVLSRPSSSAITMAFRHILSKIDFKIVTGNAVTVEVQSISIKHVGNNGTFDYSNLTWQTAPTTWQSDYSYMRGASGSLMLVPQDLTTRAWDKSAANIPTQSYIEVVYRVYETNGGKDLVGYTDPTKHPDYATLGNAVTGPLFVKVGFPLPTNWQMSKAYTYSIFLGHPDASGGNLVEGNLIDEDGKNTNLPVRQPDTGAVVNVPDPVVNLSNPITIIVSVDDWGTANEIDMK